MKKQQNDTFQFFLYHNIVPLITSAVIIALSWASLNTKLELISKDVSYIKEKIDDKTALDRDQEIRFGQLSLDVKELQTILKAR